MKNTIFNNPFKCIFIKSKDANKIIVCNRIELEIDSSVSVKGQNGELMSPNDLKNQDPLLIAVSPTEPHKAIQIIMLPPHKPKNLNPPA
jgi:hypothetical protein